METGGFLRRCVGGSLALVLFSGGVGVQSAEFCGTYRGVAESIDDPLGLGRVQVTVPDVLGSGVAWASPALPFAGLGHGLFLIPEQGDQVWVEFEGCDPQYPIWTGAALSLGDVPVFGLDSLRALVTRQGHRFLIDEQANLIELHHADGAEVTLGEGEIRLGIGATSLSLTREGIFVNGKMISRTKRK